jgi:glycosyltransferase involved in cell wall biosynthesis
LCAQEINCEVWYCSGHGLKGEMDKEFKTNVKWDVELLKGYRYEILKNNGTKDGIYSFFGLLNFGLFHRIKNLERNDILVLHGWNYASYILAFLTAVLTRKKIALRTETPLNQESSKTGLKHFLRRVFVKRFFLKAFDYVFYMGNQNKAFYLSNGVPEDRLYFAPYCVDNKRFQKSFHESDKTKLRSKYGISDDKHVILYSGKLILKKRPIDLLKVAQNLVDDNLFFVFMGDGELRSKMEDFISVNNLENVLITGFVNQSKVVDYYALSDAFVMCSGAGETWGLSTNEALNFGLPIVVSETSGNASDLVRKGQNGFTFKEGDIPDMASKIMAALDLHKKSPDKLKEKCFEVISKYSYSTIANTLKDL